MWQRIVESVPSFVEAGSSAAVPFSWYCRRFSTKSTGKGIKMGILLGY